MLPFYTKRDFHKTDVLVVSKTTMLTGLIWEVIKTFMYTEVALLPGDSMDDLVKGTNEP